MGAAMSGTACAEDRCPVDHRNMSKAEAEGLMAKLAARQGREKLGGDRAAGEDVADEKCPVDHKNMSKEEIAAYMAKHAKNGGALKAGKGKGKDVVYDVYGQEIDKANMMPAVPNQLPAPGQKEPLSTHRVKSSIPKAGEDAPDSTWTYPSPQMFYNSLKRKGKADGVLEEDMDTVVSIHNGMNEKTWAQVVDWERRYHCDQCSNPKLSRFVGRPFDMSPAARFRTLLRGYPAPFDRHDWVVDRCGEEDARYIIDYYYRDGDEPIEIHVRPALDSPGAAWDRLRYRASAVMDQLLSKAKDVDTTDIGTMQEQHVQHMKASRNADLTTGLGKEEFDFLSGLTQASVDAIAADVQAKCSKVSELLKTAGDDAGTFERANISLNYCMAQRICRPQAAGFMNALESGGDEAGAYNDMTSCLDRFHIMAGRVMMEAAGIAQSGPEFPTSGRSSVGGVDSRPVAESAAETADAST